MSRPEPPSPDQPATSRLREPVVGILARGYAFVVVSLRYFIIGGWIAALVLAFLFLPRLGTSASGGLSDLIPKHTPAARATADAARLFGAPLDAGVAIVQRNPHGIPAAAQDRAVRQAIAVDRGLSGRPGQLAQAARAAAALAQAGYPNAARVLAGPVSPGPPGGIPRLAGALPLVNSAGLIHGTAEHSTTVITFLYFRPGTSLGRQVSGAQAYVHWYLRYPGSDVVGVTGPVTAEFAQRGIIDRYLGWVEFFTVLAIAVVVGARFRSVGAPLVTLACAGTAYLIASRTVAWTARQMGLSLPADVGPILVVLLLGVTTDYSVFFLSGMRAALGNGVRRLPAARLATAEYAPIILAAGLIVAATTGSLAVAVNQSLRAFGPALGLTVLAAMVVSMTLAPALMSVFGGLLFRSVPAWRRGRMASGREGARAPRRIPGQNVRTWFARVGVSKPVALLVAAACTAGLLGLASAARHSRLGSPLIKELPAASTIRHAQQAAAEGFAPGILSPTDILAIGPGVAGQTAALARLQDELARQPGVAESAGPATLSRLSGVSVATADNPMLARSGHAARFVVVERTDPLDAIAIRRVRALTKDLPSLARSAGLAGARFEVGGETALASDSINAISGSLGRVVAAIGVVSLILLAIFLRSLLAPVYLLAASVLAVFASLGLTILISRYFLGFDSLVYFVPIAGGVLLVSLGSDYNVFVVGRIWAEGRRRPVPDAVAVAAPRASRAITTAGVALAASFAMLAVIPLEQFRQTALLMGIGVILDAIAVRSLLVPSLVVLFGRAGMWPGGRRVRAVSPARTTEGDKPA